MSKHIPGLTTPALDVYSLTARNAAQVSAPALNKLARSLNHLTVLQKKLIFSKCQTLNAVVAGATGNTVIWRGYWRSSENAHGIRCTYGMVDSDYASLNNPYLYITASNATTGASVQGSKAYFNGYSTGLSDAELLGTMHIGYFDLVGFSDDTEYVWVALVNSGLRLAFLSITEIGEPHADDTQGTVVDAGKYVAEGPLYYQQAQDISDAAKGQWRHNAAHLLSWAQDYDTAVTIDSAVVGAAYVNLLDTALTAVTSSSPGVGIQTTYHNKTSQTTVPVKLAVHAIRTAGSGNLSFKITDGTNHVELTGVTTGGIDDWYTVAGTLPAQIAKYDLHVKVSAGTFTVRAVSLFEHEA